VEIHKQNIQKHTARKIAISRKHSVNNWLTAGLPHSIRDGTMKKSN